MSAYVGGCIGSRHEDVLGVHMYKAVGGRYEGLLKEEDVAFNRFEINNEDDGVGFSIAELLLIIVWGAAKQ